jgi:hypothetical protein
MLPHMATEHSRQQIEREIEEHRLAIARLEEELVQLPAPAAPWPPSGFYVTFYLVAGLMLGTMGALNSFLFNVVGSFVVNQDPMQILRVLGTFFIGKEALTTDDMTFLMLVMLTHLSVGAVAGALFHLVLNLFWPDLPVFRLLLVSAGFGVALWLVSFYGVISWLQPLLVGEAYILHMIPVWVALLTHIVYGLTLGLLQPTGKFVPYAPPA